MPERDIESLGVDPSRQVSMDGRRENDSELRRIVNIAGADIYAYLISAIRNIKMHELPNLDFAKLYLAVK